MTAYAITAVDLALARLLLAAAGSLAAGGAVWAVAVLSVRRWPALGEQRSLWLGGQVAVAAVFVAMLLPHTERLRVAPVIEIVDSAPAPVAVPSVPVAEGQHAAVAPSPAVAPARAWLPWLAYGWLALYAAGFAYTTYRQRRARLLLHALAAAGQPLAPSDHHLGLAGRHDATLPAMIEVAAPISPMLQGLFKPRLLLPRHLRDFEPMQQQLIVEHELTHWRRHDLPLGVAALVLECLFWFNPFMRLLRVRLGWSQEFGCDRAVLRGRPAVERKAYAAALVAQLKLQRHPAGMALAFGATGEPTLLARVALIRTPTVAHGAWLRWGALAALAAVVAANLSLQPVLSWQSAAVPQVQGAPMLSGAWSALGAPTPSALAAPARLDCTLVVDAVSGAALIREGTCDTRVTPASTFKIPISLMGFDSGVLRDDHAPYMPYKASYAAANRSWRHGTDPAGWLRESIVWYSQQITAKLGAASVRNYVRTFDYGNRDLASVDGVDDAIAVSEVSPTLRISPQEQTVFLRKVVNRELPLSAHAYDVTARLLKVDAPAGGWTVHGKTGTAPALLADGSADRTQYIGWYVGWAVKNGRTLVFARLLQDPAGGPQYAGATARAGFLDDLARRKL
jgi:beta-lactamase class D/beta-lactamase regulating signal transducer with metallopeptidase domain